MMGSRQAYERGTRALALALTALILGGCQTRHPIAVPRSTPAPATAAVFTELRPGDQVRVTLLTGEVADSVVAEVRADALVVSDGRRFPYVEIARLVRQRTPAGNTLIRVLDVAGHAVVIGMTVLVVLLILNTD
jgi:hypothetical protein